MNVLSRELLNPRMSRPLSHSEYACLARYAAKRRANDAPLKHKSRNDGRW
jgi:hypothetical protein